VKVRSNTTEDRLLLVKDLPDQLGEARKNIGRRGVAPGKMKSSIERGDSTRKKVAFQAGKKG